MDGAGKIFFCNVEDALFRLLIFQVHSEMATDF